MSRSMFSNGMAIFFGMLMALLLAAHVTPKQPVDQSEAIAINMTNGLFICVSAVIGKVIGWVVGAFVCE
jgi:hypothetical protein